MRKLGLFVGVILLSSPLTLSADSRSKELSQYLKDFDANPAEVMWRIPQKKNLQGVPLPHIVNPFTAEHIQSKSYLDAKHSVKAQVCANSGWDQTPCVNPGAIPFGRAEIEGYDSPERLVDNPTKMIRNISQLDQIRTGALIEQPWSDTYWPLYQGSLGARYADPEFPTAINFLENFNFVGSQTVAKILTLGIASAKYRQLSPAEKYDLLVGDSLGQYTQSMWDEGKYYYDNYGKVETWMGICHGWAVAAYMEPRPGRVIDVMASDGKPIRFYPTDIKGLVTHLWASTNPPTKFVGGRCDLKSPQTDSNGRIIDSQCFDTNPGTWHLALINQIGLFKRSFVMDANFDYEVWNQPILGFEYTYFNPQTLDVTDDLKAATVRREDYKNDKFPSYRSSKAAYMVGVEMTVRYMAENYPLHYDVETAENDVIRTVSYSYDLELDAQGNVVGGEWYTNMHPDFLWTAPKGTKAASIVESYMTPLAQWEIGQPLPADWAKYGKMSSKYGQPIARIVERLLAFSRGQ